MFRLLILFFIPLTLFSQIVFPIKEGWSLIGLPQNITNMDKFNTDDVDIIWAYNNQSQSWEAYSPKEDKKDKIEAKNIPIIENLNSNQGFWIYSNNSWSLEFDKEQEENDGVLTLDLKEGWNLISSSINMTISPKIFSDDIIWKYSQNNEWETSLEDNDIKKIDTIANNDGLWVYTKEDKQINLSKESSKLVNFETNEELKSYIRTMLETGKRPFYGCFDISTVTFPINVEVTAAVVSSDDSTEESSYDATTTNIQENDVDEADIIKHNQNNIFYLSRNSNENQILITSFENLSEDINNEALETLQLNSNYYAKDLYLSNDNLIVLYSYNMIESRSSFLIEIYNISDIGNIALKKSFKIDGNINDSRLVDDKLIIFSQFTPYITMEYPMIYLEQNCEELYETKNYNDEKLIECYSAYYDYDKTKYYKYDYANGIIKDEYLLPSINSTDLITASKTYGTSKIDNYSNITTISVFDIEDAQLSDSVSVIADTSTLYASKDSVYLTSGSFPFFFDFTSYKEQTTIYKISLEDLEFKAKGLVDGRILNQFSLSEYNNNLRIATTQGFSWEENTNNSIYILEEKEGSLETIGSIENLGEEAEVIKSVRFINDKGYLVTFRQTDPFYTLDLSNPQEPKKVGELKISGFSEYIHPIDDSTLLTIGRGTNDEGLVQGLQIELFDVSDISKPSLLDHYIFGDNSYYSELSSNHKAFTYSYSDDFFGLPYRNYNNGPNNYFGSYKINDNKIINIENIELPFENYSYDYQTRAIYFTKDNIRYLLIANQGKFYIKKVEE